MNMLTKVVFVFCPVLLGIAGCMAEPVKESTNTLSAATSAVNRGLVGATVFSDTFPDTRTRLAASTEFDGFLGNRPFCYNVQKVYFEEGQWPTDINDPQPVGSLGGAGIALYISLKPLRLPLSPAQGEAEKGKLAQAIEMFQDANVSFKVILWQEANLFGAKGAFATPDDYKAYVAFYGPVVQAAGVQLVYDPAFASPKDATAYYPGKELTDEIIVDYYCTDHLRFGTVATDAFNTLEQIADRDGLRFGVGEWGQTDGAELPTVAQFTSWARTEILNRFAARLSAGKPNGAAIWYDAGRGGNVIDGSTDPAVIDMLEEVFDTLSRK
jgi:hypothetical protein